MAPDTDMAATTFAAEGPRVGIGLELYNFLWGNTCRVEMKFFSLEYKMTKVGQNNCLTLE